MPRTRRAVKTTKPRDTASEVDKERAEQMRVYLKDFDETVETNLKNMKICVEKLCEAIKSTCSVEILKLSKHMRKMTISEFREKGGNISAVNDQYTNGILLNLPSEDTNNDRENVSPKSSKKTTSKQNKVRERKRTASTFGRRSTRSRIVRSAARSNGDSSSVNSNSKSLGKRQRSIQSSSKGKYSNLATPFTPKFDPRLPLTPASGLRHIRPGEKVVLMSISGSPLIPLDSMSELAINLPVQDSKTSEINPQLSLNNSTMDNESRSNEMQRKFRSLQKKLKDVVKAPSSSK